MGDCGLAAAVFEPALGDEPGQFRTDSCAVLDGAAGGTLGGAVDAAAGAAYATAGGERFAGHVRLHDLAGYEQQLRRGDRGVAARSGIRAHLSAGGGEDRTPFPLLSSGIDRKSVV